MTRHLILILGDQLSPTLSSLKDADPQTDRILMAEVREEATYVKHHKKKIAFLFSAMRHFADELTQQGWRVDYRLYTDPKNSGSLAGEVEAAVQAYTPRKIIVTEPGEWRLKTSMLGWKNTLNIPVEIRHDTRFLCSHNRFQNWAAGRKQLRMEYFLSLIHISSPRDA